MKRLQYIFILLIVCMTVVFSSFTTAFAEPVYRGYCYDTWGEAVPALNGYQPVKGLTGDSVGAGSFKNPEDMFVDRENNLYILDTGNNRIVVLDAQYRLKNIIDHLEGPQGTESLNNATGLFVVSEKEIYVADRENGRVLILNQQGKILQSIGKPVSNMIAEDLVFKPKKVAVDRLGIVYILAQNIYAGAITVDRSNNFLGYYGSNRVEPTLSLLSDFFWKKLLNQKQKDKMMRYVPIEYSNFDIDERNFVYSCTNNSQNSLGEIKKLNPKGANILPEREYGDSEIVWEGPAKIDTSFIDIKVDEESFISAVDTTRGRVFQFDSEGNLLFVFGGIGKQFGTFKYPAAVESMNGHLLVLDSQKGSITVFEPTQYGIQVRKAVTLYNNGMYEESVELWNEILRRNGNFEIAYNGMGKAYFEYGDYQKAMECFQLGYKKDAYSNAFKEYRKIRADHFFVPVAVVILLLLGLFFYLDFTSEKRKKRYSQKECPVWRYPFYTLFHPFQGYEGVKHRNKGSLAAAIFILFMWFLAAVFERQMTGFIFNDNQVENLNSILMLVKTAGLFMLFVIANWAICTIMEGKGKFREIIISISYAMLPFVLATFLCTLLSNILVREEYMLISLIMLLAKVWMVVMVAVAMMSVHEYTFKKSVISIGLTLAGMGIIVFIGIMVFSLYQQCSSFAVSIYNEVMLKF